MGQSRVPNDEFEAHRRALEAIAYRMLGSLAEAQDVVQETYLRWRNADVSQVTSPRAWLVTVCTRLAINSLKSARARREEYVGVWLPEPLLDSCDSSLAIERDESISLALLVALERLSPLERAAFLLYEVFDYDFESIGRILERSPVACRKLVSRARAAVRAERPRFASSAANHRALVEAFAKALETGETEGFMQLLARDAVLLADGGGVVSASSPLVGGEAVGSLLGAVSAQLRNNGTAVTARVCWVNGVLGVALYEDGTLTTVYSVTTGQGMVQSLLVQRNPSKLLQAGNRTLAVFSDRADLH